MFQPPKEFSKITPYKGGASVFVGQKKPIKLSSNEGAFGASPKAVQAFKKAIAKKTFSIYPESAATMLREKIAAHYKIPAKQIICGNGSGDLLQLLTRTALFDGGEAIHTKYGFSLYPTLIRANGGVPVAAAEKNFITDIETIIKKANRKTKIVLLANPNNPTGTYLNFTQLKLLRKKLPQHILLVIDSAYAEYVDMKDYEAGIKLVKQNDNIVMTRTFSKIYGLANLRLGWAYAPPKIAAAINRIRLPFNVPTPNLLAGIAALDDISFIKKSQKHNKKYLEVMKNELTILNATNSVANFLLLDFKSKKNANAAWRFLGRNGLILRQMAEYNLDSYLRISIGAPKTNHKAISLLNHFQNEKL